MPAPVVLFVYNRPRHAAATLAALAANAPAARTPLIIYADGARGEVDVPLVSQTRALFKDVTGFASLTVHERENNHGLADSVAGGVTEVMREYGRAIVLEDDIVTSPHFLEYMNAALERYAPEERVMHIAAHLPALNGGLPESFFLRQSSCWGWASWEQAWRHFHRRREEFIRAFSPKDIRRFNLDGACDYWRQLVANENGALETWTVYWYACVFSRDGLCLHPRHSSPVKNSNRRARRGKIGGRLVFAPGATGAKTRREPILTKYGATRQLFNRADSLVQNIGFDGSGENCGPGKSEATADHAPAPQSWPVRLEEHRKAMRRCQARLRGDRPPVGLTTGIRAACASLLSTRLFRAIPVVCLMALLLAQNVSAHEYLPTRQTFILAQAGQLPEQGALMLFGDSIMDGLLPPLHWGNVLNAGVGSARAADILPLMRRIFALRKPAVVLVAVGVNDAQRRDEGFEPERLENIYLNIYINISMSYPLLHPPTPDNAANRPE